MSAQPAARIDIPQSHSPADSARVMELTKVSGAFAYLSAEEKEVIQWLNIARMYPKWFLYFRKIKDTDPVYTQTLISTLMTMKPIEQKLTPNKKLFEMARCHASTAGALGYMGHERQDSSCIQKMNAECIHYGGGRGAYKVERLLIDKDIPSLGHRLAILNPKYSLIAVSIKPFNAPDKKEITVIDFGL